MCLATRQQRSYKTKKDITVYKLFKYCSGIDDCLNSPYAYYHYLTLGTQEVVKMKKSNEGNFLDTPDIDVAMADKHNPKPLNFISVGYHSA